MSRFNLFKKTLFSLFIQRRELGEKVLSKLEIDYIKPSLTPLTIDGKNFDPSRLSDNNHYIGRTSFTQGDLIDEILDHLEEIDFVSDLGMCAGLTRYWFLSQGAKKEESFVDQLKKINFNNLSFEDRRLIEDIDRLQRYLHLPTFIRTSSSLFFATEKKYSSNYFYLNMKKEQISLIKNSYLFSEEEKKSLINLLDSEISSKFFYALKDQSIPQECIDSLLKEATNESQTFTEIIFFSHQQQVGHVTGLTVLRTPDGKLIMKYFDPNTGERIFYGNDLQSAKTILMEELNQSNPFKEYQTQITISSYKCEKGEEVYVKKFNLFLIAFALYYASTFPDKKSMERTDTLSQEDKQEGKTSAPKP